MKATIPDQALMAEAADEIKRLKLEVASLKKGLIEANERAEDADDLYESVLHKSANDQEKLEEEREELENKIEFLEADRLRLANLIHPDTPGCAMSQQGNVTGARRRLRDGMRTCGHSATR